jgi:hypothetical protein
MGVLRDSIYPFHRSPSSSVLWIGSKASLWEVGFFLYNMRDAAEAETTGGPPGDGDVLAFAPLPSSLCCCCVAYCPLLMLHDYYCVPVQASMEWKYIWIDGPTVHASFFISFCCDAGAYAWYMSAIHPLQNYYRFFLFWYKFNEILYYVCILN